MNAGPYSRRRARSASFHAILLRVPSQFATLLSYVVLVRYMSESEFGIYSLFYATLPLLGTLISFGMENTLRRFQPEYLRNGENRLAHRLSRRIGLLRLVSTTLAVMTLLLFWNQLAPFFGVGEYRDDFTLFAFVIVTHFQCQILTMSLSAHLLQQYSVGLTAGWSILKLVGYIAIGYFTTFDLRLAIAVDLAAYLIYFCGLKLAYMRKADHRTGTQDALPKEERKRLVRYAAYYSFNDAGTLALDSRKESFFLAAFLDAVAVGAYAFATRFNVMLGRISPVNLLDSIIQPMFVSLDYAREPERIHRYFSLLINTALLVRVPMLAFSAIFHRQIVEVLFAGQFIDYSYLLAIVAVFSIGNVIGPPITLVAQMEEKAQFVLASKIFGVVGVAASLLLIPRIGIVGAALASGLAVWMKNLFIWWFVRELAVWKNALSFVIRSTLLWAGYTALALPLRGMLTDQPLLMLVIALAVWALFALVQVRIAIGPSEREIIGGLFSGKEKKLLRLVGLV